MTAAAARDIAARPEWPVGPDTCFVTPQRVPEGVDAQSLSRFGDDIWRFTPLIPQHQQQKSVLWKAFGISLRESWRRAAWVFLNLPTPDRLLDRVMTKRVRWSSAASVHTMMNELRRFDSWLADRPITSLQQVDDDVLIDYAQYVASLKLSLSRSTAALYTVSRLWGAAPHLPASDRIPLPPWEVTHLTDYLPGIARHSNENSTKPIHPAVMSPLLIWSLRFVDDFADDIIAAWHDYQQLIAQVRPGRNPGATAALKAAMAQAQRGGPAIPGAQWENGQVTIACTYLAGLHDTSVAHVNYLASRHRKMNVAGQAPLPTPIRGLLHGKPWTGHIDFQHAQILMRLLNTAGLVVVGYLSGLRPAEVLLLRKGCCPPPTTDGKVLRYQLHGNFLKGARDDEGRATRDGSPRTVAWTVIEPVAHAVAVLERIASTDFLFALNEPWLARAGPPARGALITTHTAMTRIHDLVSWINAFGAQHRLPGESIPADPEGKLALSRLRRTVAWHIARLPQGRIALAIQYGHLRALQSDAYGARAREGLRRVVDVESAMNIAQFLQEVAERLDAGEGISGPAARRMVQSARARAVRFEGLFLPDRDLRAILNDPQFQVFDNADAFLTCNKDPDKALCDPDRGKAASRRHRPPALDRCDPSCANIARTDTHIQSARDEITRLHAEAADPLTPIPLAARQRQRIANLTELISRHERTRITLHISDWESPWIATTSNAPRSKPPCGGCWPEHQHGPAAV